MDGFARTALRSMLRRLGSLVSNEGRRSAEGGSAGDAGRVVRPWRADSVASHPSVGLTPARAAALLQTAEFGAPQQQFELFHDMLMKWPRLAAVEQTRRLALTGLEWDVTPARTRPGDSAAEARARDAAEYCREVLHDLPALRPTLAALGHAMGYGVAVAEIVWESGRVIDLTPVPWNRLRSDFNEPWRLRVLTEESPTEGVLLDEQPHKWIVHQPSATAGRRFSGGILRASTLLFLAQSVSFKDWLAYSQIAGMPVRVAQFDPGMDESDQQKLLQMLASLGTEAVATFSKNIDLKLLETGRAGNRLYEQLQDHCNIEVTILWLGQHLTTDVGPTGSRAAAEVHDRVREDLLNDDILAEGETIQRDLFAPLVQARFGDGVPTPRFRRSLVQSIDSRSLAQTLAVAVNEVGLRVPVQWAHEALGIPVPQGDEAVLERGGE